MSRTILIPAASLPGSPATAGRADLALTLVDAWDQPLPVSDLPNAALFVGTHYYTLTQTALAITVATQDQLHGETYYQVEVRHGTSRWCKRVQVPTAAGADLTWAEFVGLSAPVAPPASRLLPDAALIADGWSLTVAQGQPVWSPVIPGSGDMQALLYDPRGVRADAFSAPNLTGAIDGGTF
jgi:hypothetical protein